MTGPTTPISLILNDEAKKQLTKLSKSYKTAHSINGMFVPIINHSRYKAVSFDVNWYSGEVYGSILHDFGSWSINVHYMQPIGDNFLLLGARARLYKDGSTDECFCQVKNGPVDRLKNGPLNWGYRSSIDLG